MDRNDEAGRLCAEVGIDLATGGDRWDVVLAAPERRNAQTPATWRALAAVGVAVAEAAPRVVVLSATGPAFSAGLDRAMFAGTSPGVPGEPGLPQLAALPDDALDAEIAAFQDGFTWWRDSDAITVAAVQGHAVGAGFQLALGCDLRVVADDVAFAMKETSLGLVPDLAGTWPLVDAVGYSRALEICVSGRTVGAAEAVAAGLAVASVPAAGLAAAVDALVASLLAPPAAAASATKHLLAGAAGRTPDEQQAAERLAQRDRLRDLVRLMGASSPVTPAGRRNKPTPPGRCSPR